MDLISVVNNIALLDKDTAEQIASFERRIRALEKQEEMIKSAILAEMESKNIVKVEAEPLTISYVAGHDKESFDTKRFKAENADLYDEYVKITRVKSSIRIKVEE